MILGVHNMTDAISHYTKEHVTDDGALWILGLDALLLVPIVFAVFFYPMAVLIGLIGVGAALVLAVGFLRLVHALQGHRTGIGH